MLPRMDKSYRMSWSAATRSEEPPAQTRLWRGASKPGAQVMLLTDSAYVLQVLEGGTVGFAHVSLQACCGTVVPTGVP